VAKIVHTLAVLQFLNSCWLLDAVQVEVINAGPFLDIVYLGRGRQRRQWRMQV